MLTEKHFEELSRDTYKIDSKSIDYDYQLREGAIIQKDNEFDYMVLKTIDNTSNGMQAMAVAPIENGKADTSEIVIAYAGTNFSDRLDLYTDL